MVKETHLIETGVDKLVLIVKTKKRISVQEAAKELGVGPTVVEEWADFLEEEGIISIEYKFATPYLVERKFTKAELKTKEKELEGEKETFIRKAEATLSILDREGAPFQKFKTEFEQLKKELGSDLRVVESELKQLEKFELLKNDIDKQIKEHEGEFHQKMDGFEGEIIREQEKYSEMLKELENEEQKIDREKLEVLSLREKELDIRNKLSQFNENIAMIHKEIENENKLIDDSENRLGDLKKLSEKIKSSLEEKKRKGSDLVAESNEHKEKISQLQDAVLAKVEKNKEEITKKIDEGRISTQKFRNFFNKKLEIEQLIKSIDKQKDELEYELIKLIKKSKAYHLSSSKPKEHSNELSEAFENIKKKKDNFEKEMYQLGSVIDNK